MRLLFADETDRQASAAKRSFFCICGLSVDGAEAVVLSNELEGIKSRYGLANLKEARKTGLSEDIRLAITNEIQAALSAHKAKIIAIVLGDISLSYLSPLEDIYMGAMSFLLERFALPLMRGGEFGLVTFDSVDKSLEKELRKRFYEYV
ncbi:MAG: hypothetical protein NUV78_00240, partial [Candidatus Zambryskibacteria bacterium]|nr:hypothetical protein [Candidatus Zambryskibacteria bacterium]